MPDRNAQLIAQSIGNLVHSCAIPTAQKDRSDRANIWAKPSGHAPLQAPNICFCRCKVLLAREKERDIDSNAVCNRFLDRRYAVACAWNFDEQIRTIPFSMEKLCCQYRFLGVVSEKWRQFK